MESEQLNIDQTKKGFFNYIFNFDETNSAQFLNMYQYAIIAIPLVLISLKLLNYVSPEVDENKGTLEILLEILISINWILLSIWFLNKIIRFIPTRSKTPYSESNEINFMIPLLIVLFTINSKLGNKINILIERAVDLYNGKTNLKEISNAKQNDIKTTQPISPPINQNLMRSPGGVDAVYGVPPSNNINLQQQNNQKVDRIGGAETQGQQINQLHRETVQSNASQMNFNQDFAGPQIEPIAANEAFTGGFSSF
tara:strand:+ start:2456 stop:3217 length:762 start_codon:yes stop_codon:yes gene_type:complete